MKEMIVLSLGAGLQSSAMLIASNSGLHGVPRADFAVFADTGDEPRYVYEQIERLKQISDIRIDVVRREKKLSEELEERKALGGKKSFACVPAFVRKNDGSKVMMRRQCSREYKITPIEQHCRALANVKRKQRMTAHVTMMIGISLDEVSRVKPSRRKWITNIFPLIDARLRRRDCERIIIDAGLPIPKKSACVYCPYSSTSFKKDLRDNYASDFDLAIRVDETIRDMNKNTEQFILRSCEPLRESSLGDEQLDLFDEECDGVCGI